MAEPLGSLRLQAVLRRSRQLGAAASASLSRLERALAGTTSQILLTNPDGVIIHVGQRAPGADSSVLPALALLGMDLSENSLGTTAPGIVSTTGIGCAVLANEHFNEAILQVQCAAAPIHDVEGRLAGVLDLSVEGRGFGFDALALISSYARDMENRLLQIQSDELLIIAFHAEPILIGTPWEALAGIDGNGTVRWINEAGMRLTGGRRGILAEQILGHSVPALLGLVRHGDVHPLCLLNGLTIWLRARLHARDGAGLVVPSGWGPASQGGAQAVGGTVGFPEKAVLAAAVPALPDAGCGGPEKERPPMTLNQAHAAHIASAVLTAGGNVAQAARLLGVSRGVIYRHLQRDQASAAPAEKTAQLPPD